MLAAFPLFMAAAYRVKAEAFSLVVAFSAMVLAVLLVVTASAIAITPVRPT